MLLRFFIVVAKSLSKGRSVGVRLVQVNLRSWKSGQNLVLPCQPPHDDIQKSSVVICTTEDRMAGVNCWTSMWIIFIFIF